MHNHGIGIYIKSEEFQFLRGHHTNLEFQSGPMTAITLAYITVVFPCFEFSIKVTKKLGK